MNISGYTFIFEYTRQDEGVRSQDIGESEAVGIPRATRCGLDGYRASSTTILVFQR